MRVIIKQQNEMAAASRKQLHTSVEDIRLTVSDVDHRLKTLEATFNDMTPTVREFVAWKERAKGAGMLGRILWVAGGVILAAAAWLVANFNWLIGRHWLSRTLWNDVSPAVCKMLRSHIRPLTTGASLPPAWGVGGGSGLYLSVRDEDLAIHLGS